jgi:hypothetical protein
VRTRTSGHITIYAETAIKGKEEREINKYLVRYYVHHFPAVPVHAMGPIVPSLRPDEAAPRIIMLPFSTSQCLGLMLAIAVTARGSNVGMTNQ